MKIAILGAGLAGLTLASELHKKGATVCVFEQAQTLGGRLNCQRMPWGTIDIGAQYFTAREERFKQQVNTWLGTGVVVPWDFTPHQVRRSSLTLSPDNVQRYIGQPNMNSLTHSLAEDLHIVKGTQITSVVKQNSANSNRQWTLLDKKAKPIDNQFDWVVSSLPAEQSRVLFKHSTIASYIPRSAHLPCWAVGLATQGRVDFNVQGIFGDNDVAWVSRQSSKPGWIKTNKYDDCWVIHFTSDWSERHANAPYDIITSEAMKWLSHTLREHKDNDFKLQYCKLHFWNYAQFDNPAASGKIIADKKLGIGQIGAWLAGGRVEGAYVSAINFLDYFID